MRTNLTTPLRTHRAVSVLITILQLLAENKAWQVIRFMISCAASRQQPLRPNAAEHHQAVLASGRQSRAVQGVLWEQLLRAEAAAAQVLQLEAAMVHDLSLKAITVLYPKMARITIRSLRYSTTKSYDIL